jgi:hypothetical protein
MDALAIDFASFLSASATPKDCNMPIGSKAPSELVGDDYDGVAALRGHVVPRLADDGNSPNAPPHVRYCAWFGCGGFFLALL